jgi:hypothetical protein
MTRPSLWNKHYSSKSTSSLGSKFPNTNVEARGQLFYTETLRSRWKIQPKKLGQLRWILDKSI